MKTRQSLLLTPILSLSLAIPMSFAADGNKDEAPSNDATLTREAPAEADANLEAAFDFLPDVVARCNKMTISASDVRDALPPRLVMMMANGYTPEPAQLKQVARQTVNQLINQELLLETAIEAGFEPDRKEAAKQVEELHKKVGDDKFRAGLKHQGVTRSDLIQRIARHMAVNQWIEENIMPAINIDPQTVKQAYEKHEDELRIPEKKNVSHILVKVDQDADKKTRKQARVKLKKLATEIENGADFSEVAKTHSDCPSARDGGDLGEISRSETVKPFSDVAFALKEGEISDIVETRFGYHLIKAGKKTPAHTPSFEDVRDKIKQQMVQAKMDEKLSKVVKKARQKADIKVFLEKEIDEAKK